MFYIPKEMIIIDNYNNIEFSNCPMNLKNVLYIDRGEFVAELRSSKNEQQASTYIVHEKVKTNSVSFPTIEFYLPTFNETTHSFNKTFWIFRNVSDRDTEYNNLLEFIRPKSLEDKSKSSK